MKLTMHDNSAVPGIQAVLEWWKGNASSGTADLLDLLHAVRVQPTQLQQQVAPCIASISLHAQLL